MYMLEDYSYTEISMYRSIKNEFVFFKFVLKDFNGVDVGMNTNHSI